MKRFSDIRQLNENKTNVVFDKKINNIPVVISKSNDSYKTLIDGDVLDEYSSQAEAEMAAKEFIKQYKGKK
jgi:hypothetical protein